MLPLVLAVSWVGFTALEWVWPLNVRGLLNTVCARLYCRDWHKWMVPVLWKLSLMRERRHSYTFFKLPGLVNFLLSNQLADLHWISKLHVCYFGGHRNSSYSEVQKRKGRKALQFHKTLLTPGTQNMSFKKNLPLDNLCSLGSPFIVTIHPFTWYLTQSKQLHRKWGNQFLSTSLNIWANARHSVGIHSQSDVAHSEVPPLWHISASPRWYLCTCSSIHPIIATPVFRSLCDHTDPKISGGCKDNPQNSQKPPYSSRSTGPGCATTNGGTWK